MSAKQRTSNFLGSFGAERLCLLPSAEVAFVGKGLLTDAGQNTQRAYILVVACKIGFFPGRVGVAEVWGLWGSLAVSPRIEGSWLRMEQSGPDL